MRGVNGELPFIVSTFVFYTSAYEDIIARHTA